MLQILMRIWITTRDVLGSHQDGGSSWKINIMEGGNLKSMEGTYILQKERS